MICLVRCSDGSNPLEQMGCMDKLRMMYLSEPHTHTDGSSYVYWDLEAPDDLYHLLLSINEHGQLCRDETRIELALGGLLDHLEIVIQV